MRSAVENLKRADGERARDGMAVTDDLSQVLVEIMLQVGATNNVFREMDGFLVLMSVLSTIQDHHQTQDDHTAAIETTRLVFVVLAEATTNHLENSGFFRVCNFNVPMQLIY
jgi:heptaprenylglyceryl phosphate synthase